MYVKGQLLTDRDGEICGSPEAPEVYLAHSCDEWVIGGPEEIRALIEDLQAALDAFKK